MIDIEKIQNGFDWLQSELDNVDEVQSIDVLIQRLSAINSTISWAYNQMAIAKKDYNAAKVAAYHRLMVSSSANEKYYSPSLAKDYVNSLCIDAAYAYDLTERFCRSLIHISDNTRTCISALKEEAKMNNYNANLFP